MNTLLNNIPERLKVSLKGLLPAEERILGEIESGKLIDFSESDSKSERLKSGKEGDPNFFSTWSQSRVVRPEFLAWLVTSLDVSEHLPARGIDIRGIIIKGRLELEAAVVPRPLRILDSAFDGGINLDYAKTKGLCLSGNLFKSEGTANALSADGLTVEGDLEADNAHVVGTFRMIGSHVAGQLSLDGIKLSKGSFKEDAFCGDNICIGEDFFVRNAIVDSGFSVYGAKIGGDLHCENTLFKLAISAGEAKDSDCTFAADNIVVKGDLYFEKCSLAGELRLLRGRIDGMVYMRPLEFMGESDSLDLSEVRVGKELFLDGIKTSKRLQVDLRGAQVDELWLPDSTNLNSITILLQGLEYVSLGSNREIDFVSLKSWFECQPRSSYFPQPYQQAAKVLRQMGYDSDAKKVLIAKERRRRKYGKIGFFALLSSLFLDVLIGFGHRPMRAVIAILVAIAVGTWIFSGAWYNQCIVRAGSNDQISCSEFSPLWYAADKFFPVIALDQETAWTPSPSSIGVWWFQRIYILVGWFLTTLLIAALTGMIRRE